MTAAQTLDSVDSIRVDSILVTPRLRGLREDAVVELTASIQQVGLINPITIWRPNGRVVPHLISGAHRLEVARRLGWETIPCCTIAGDTDRAVLIEIDENLARGELSAAERAIHIAKRKEVYERLHPETKQGGAPGKAGGGKKPAKDANLAPLASFKADTAAKTGRSRTDVARDATRAKNIPQIAECIGTSLDQGDELDALAKLPPEQQGQLIAKAKTGKKTSAKPEAKRVVRMAKEAMLAVKTERAAQTLGAAQYAVIYADPPWRLEPYSRVTGMDRTADNHYPTLTIEDIKAIQPPAAKDCVLFLWTTAPMQREAHAVLDAWGFTYKSQVIWAKDRVGTGYWFRNRHEVLMVATRGDIPAPAPGDQYESVIQAPVGRHSEKPIAFAEMIEELFPNNRLLEMFARTPRAGWDSWGNEAETA